MEIAKISVIIYEEVKKSARKVLSLGGCKLCCFPLNDTQLVSFGAALFLSVGCLCVLSDDLWKAINYAAR